jgi:predicted HAD superfamily Cof-like phosphohydrolase
MNYEKMLREFHVAYGLPHPGLVRRPTGSQSRLRQDLLIEEMAEYLQAEREHKIIDIADALADILYI